MHSGHYNAIRQARQLCDILVVGVHSDAEIAKHKGPPVMNEQERLACVKACKWVDEVAFDTPYDPSIELLDKLNCDFGIHGDDTSTTSDGQDAYGELKKAGRMRIIKRTAGVSTTDLVGRLLLLSREHLMQSPRFTPQTPPGSPQGPLILSSNVKDIPPLIIDRPAVPLVKESKQHYAAGLTNFLPTAWRIAQFSNHRQPSKSDKVVYIDGAFDMFHVGHVEILEKAKKLGTFLYVGLHDDDTVNKHKGRNYPIMNLHERAMNILSCRYVDEVVMGAPWAVTRDLITTLNISVVVSGSNTKMDLEFDKSGEDPYVEAKRMNLFKVVENPSPLTTEAVVKRIIENRMKYEKRNESRSKKDLSYLQNKQYVAEI